MTELILLLCLKAFPTECHEETRYLEASEIQCIATAQQAMVQIVSTRPKWMVKRYRCERGIET